MPEERAEFDEFTVRIREPLPYDMTEGLLQDLLRKGAFKGLEDGREATHGPIYVRAVALLEPTPAAAPARAQTSASATAQASAWAEAAGRMQGTGRAHAAGRPLGREALFELPAPTVKAIGGPYAAVSAAALFGLSLLLAAGALAATARRRGYAPVRLLELLHGDELVQGPAPELA